MNNLEKTHILFPEYIECIYSGTRLKKINISNNILNKNIFRFLDRGAYGLTYINYITNRLLKLIEILEWDTIETFQDEVEKQTIANYYDLAPKIYNHGIFKKIQTNINKKFYYIEMEYLSPQTGWINTQISNKDLSNNIFKFVNMLINNTGMYNIEDPWVHIYYNINTNKMYMIDYGKVHYCNKYKSICKQEMLNILGLGNYI